MKSSWVRKLTALPVVAFGLVLNQMVPALAANVQNVDVPIVGDAFINPCNGDAFTASGTFHLVVNMTTDSNGGFHLTEVDNTSNLKSDAPALPSMSNYVVSQTDVLSLNENSSGTTDETAVDHLNVISQGPAPNFLEHVTFHFTINSVGVVTAVVDNVRFTCT